jgi:AcrR family transcriptional regulator
MKGQSTETTRRILDAATEVFAEVGFGGARVDEIAKRAGINKAALYYHIGGKEELYAEVLHRFSSDVVERVMKDIQATDSPEEKLKRYIYNLAHFIDQNPAVAPLILREIATGGQNLSELFIQTLVRMISALAKILEEGERQGVFIKTVPLVVHFMIVGSTVFFKAKGSLVACHPELSEVQKTVTKNFSGEIGAEVERLVLRAVKK